MKFLNLERKLKNSVLAVLFAVAVMFVMPATAFADDIDDVDNNIDNDILTNVEAVETEIDIENNENNNNMDSEADANAEPSAVTEAVTENENFVDNTENTEPEITDTDALVSNDNCYGICCDACDENCNGTCCDMCTINHNHADDVDVDDVNVPDNSEYEFRDDFTADTDVSANVGSETDDGSKEDSLGNSYGEITTDSTDEFTDFNENITPAIPNEPIFPYDYYDNGMVTENPEPEYASTDGDTDKNSTYEEEEIIFDDDDLTYDESFEMPDDSNSENLSDTSGEGEENTDNSDEENFDSTTDEENNDNSDSVTDESDAADADDDSENSEDVTDEEISDSEISDDMTDEDDTADSDSTADEDASDDIADEEASDEDDSESEASEDDNPVINVVLPASISVVVNPYNLKTSSGNEFCYSILSPEYAVKNYSNCDVSIVATVTASTTGGIILSPNSLSGNETDFMAFVYLEATNKSNVYSDDFYDGSNQLAFSNGTMTKEILTLADGSNGETIGYFRIKGDAVLPVGKQCSDQAMINMIITFDIKPIDKVVASDDEVNETEDIGNTEDSENTESTESTNSIENDDNTDNIESIESTESTDNTEDI